MKRPVTVRDLKAAIADLDDDMPLVCNRYSDYQEQELPTVVEMARLDGRWVDWDPAQWENRTGRDFYGVPASHRKPRAFKVLYFRGN